MERIGIFHRKKHSNGVGQMGNVTFCKVCGRKLKSEKSIKNGMGPSCGKKLDATPQENLTHWDVI